MEKAFEQAITTGDQDKAQTQFRALSGYLDKIALTSTLHKNTAARMKSRAARRLAKLKTT